MPPPSLLESCICFDLDDHRGRDSGDRDGLAAKPAQLAGAQFTRPRVLVGVDEHRRELGRLSRAEWMGRAGNA